MSAAADAAATGASLEDERRARVELGQLFEVDDPRIARLVHEHGAVEVRDRCEQRLPADEAERILDRAAEQGLRYVVPGDAEWPEGLDDLAFLGRTLDKSAPPLGLWAMGSLPLTALRASVGIVGSRTGTSYGADVASELAAHAGREGHVVVSGMAFGIDAAAHRGALSVGAPTAAFLACGADVVYPTAHAGLHRAIAASGVVVSEQPPGASPMKHRFLSRNRLIAACAQGTVVVEAALRSGALSTANWAAHLGRHVMGVPGPVTSAASAGVNQLLRHGVATVVTNGEEMLEHLRTVGERPAEEWLGLA